ncbi:hypothetical protein [Thiomicrorhabdus sp.]|uniref:hypothetical protein n=1 Tax=Thiomicrorhabdus sp. TaxID=2039724 RepID=UPI0029C6EA70|nr:hypothetical protein [Thiomicrorhabdus sp.]
MENLTLGAKGWQHPAWEKTFYPEDMPEEWQLDYYANEFRALLIPYEIWLRWDENQLEEIEEALEVPFACCFEAPLSIEDEALRQLETVAGVLGDRAYGVLLRGGTLQKQHGVQEGRLAGLPVTLVSEQSALPGWQWQYNGVTVSGRPLGYVDGLPASAGERTALLRSFVDSLPDGQTDTVFFVDVEGIEIDSLRQLKLMAELLGY